MVQPFNVRGERSTDTQAIAIVNQRAFGGMAEPLVVALARQHGSFDPALSLVAERGGEVIGHALFLRHTVRLLGQDVAAVGLGPIAVAPAAQRQGIGGALIKVGHALARENGAAFSFLLGHTDYYPRFGYRTHAHGAAALEVTITAGSAPSPADLQQRPPTEADLPALRTLWYSEESAVDFAVYPGDSLLDWISPNPNIDCTVWLRDGTVVGYTRVSTADRLKPRCFLATDAEAAHQIAQSLSAEGGTLTLPLHPASTSAAAFGTRSEVTAWGAAMACPLAPSPLDDYLAQVGRGSRPVGRVVWPVMFDFA
jgi:putative acetyltransferase